MKKLISALVFAGLIINPAATLKAAEYDDGEFAAMASYGAADYGTGAADQGAGLEGSYEDQTRANGAYGDQTGANGSYGGQTGVSGSYGDQTGGNGAYGGQTGANGSYGDQMGTNGSYGGQTDANGNGAYGGQTGANGSYGGQTGGAMPNGGSSAGQAYYGNYFEDETGGYSASARSAGSRIDLNSDTYIVRDGDDLWLVMGGIKAKLDVLVYSDPTKSDVSKLSEDVMKALNGGLDHNVAEGNRSARRDDSTRQNKNSLTATPVY